MVYICPGCFKISDSNVKKCRYCGCDFEKVSDAQYSDKVVTALDHPDHNVAIIACKIIGRLKIKEAEDKLIKKLKILTKERINPYFEKAIIEALSAIGTEKAYLFLTKNRASFSIISKENFNTALNTIKNRLTKNYPKKHT